MRSLTVYFTQKPLACYGGTMTAKAFFRIIAEERIIILAVVTLTIISAVVAGQIIPPDVSAVAQVQVYEADRATSLLGLADSAKSVDHDVLMDTHVRLATSPAVAQRVIERLGLTETPESLLQRITVSALGRANVLTFEAVDTSPEAAAKLANTWVAEYIAWSSEHDVKDLEAATAALAPRITAAEQRLAEVQARIKTQGHTKELDTALSAAATDYEQLLIGADRLQLLSNVSSPSLAVVSDALAETRSTGMAMAIDALKGLIAGLILGVLMGLLRHRLASTSQPA